MEREKKVFWPLARIPDGEREESFLAVGPYSRWREREESFLAVSPRR
jgi:hypothetical protein